MSEDSIEINNEEFKYSIAQQKEIFVVSFVGILNGRAAKKIEECLGRLQESQCRLLVINFREATHIEPTAYRHLVQLQHSIRKNEGSILRLCGFNPTCKSLLTDNGIIRGNELSDNIRAALSELTKMR